MPLRVDTPLGTRIPDTISRGKRTVLEREAEFMVEETEEGEVESVAVVAAKSCGRWYNGVSKSLE
jgi:hypothetical protein